MSIFFSADNVPRISTFLKGVICDISFLLCFDWPSQTPSHMKFG